LNKISAYPTKLSSDSHHFFLHSGSKKLIIFFAAQDMKPGKYNFFQMGKEIEENVFFVNDLTDQWYQNGIESFGETFESTIDVLQKWIRHLKIDEVYTLGTSMGGYAAIMYGVHLNANILSFAPEIILKTPYSRSKKKIRAKTKIHYLSLNELMKGYTKPITVICGESDVLDIYFTGLLTPTKTLQVITIKGADHYIPMFLTRASYTTNMVRTFYQSGKPDMNAVFEVGNILKNKSTCKKLYAAYIALQRKEYHIVELITNDILDNDVHAELAYYLKGSALLKVGNYRDAKVNLAIASLLAPSVAEYLFSYSHAVRMSGDEIQSLYLLNLLLQKFPNFDKAYYAKGMINYKLNNFHDALQSFDKAYLLNASYEKMRIRLMRKIYKKLKLKLKTYHKQKPIIDLKDSREQLFAWHINEWKRDHIVNIFPEKQIIFFPFKLTEKHFHTYWKKYILNNSKNRLLVWGMNCPEFLQEFALKHNIVLEYVEDGFIRSVDLGANHSLPLSLNFDKKTLYFNATKESELEYLLQNYDFNKDSTLTKRAIDLKRKILDLEISKYNHAKRINLNKLYGEKIKKRVLVIGQVEDDASIRFGCNKPFTNNDLVRLAYKENKDAQIIYKPHPDVLFKKRKELSNPEEIKHLALVITESIPISQSLETVDHVYTITSQVGFEALLRDIKVTTIGSPFYANWGVTDDRQKNTRRSRKLTINNILAIAYILYPKYYHPETSTHITPEEAIDILVEQREKRQ
jgi:capsular polysaccharide export protein